MLPTSARVDSSADSGAGSAFVAGINLLDTGTGFLLLAGAVASFFKGSIAQACPFQAQGLARAAHLGAGLGLEFGHYLVAEPAQLLEDHVLGRTNY